MTVLDLGALWAHLATSFLAVGAFVTPLLVGPARWDTARAWERRTLARGRLWALLALLSTLATLAGQVARAEGRAGGALEPAAWGRLLAGTALGRTWSARMALLALLVAFLAACRAPDRRADRVALHAEGALLAAAALGLLGAAGHATASTPWVGPTVALAALHLLAAGAWAGSLLPLAALLVAASREGGADARPCAVVAARRFSRVAPAAVLLLVATGAWSVAVHAGGLPGLVGTTYGRLLLIKLALLAGVLALAVAARRTLPALAGEAIAVGRPALRRLAGLLRAEAAVLALLLGVVAALAATPPGRHEAPTWPFGVRLSAGPLARSDAARLRVLAGSQLAVLGLSTGLAALVVRRRRGPLLGAGAGLLAGGLALALPPVTVAASPTTYVRPAVPYHAASIARGLALWAGQCEGCHGPAGLPAERLVDRTAGDLFGAIATGVPGAARHAFGDRLAPDERWDLVNAIRAREAAATARLASPVAGPGPPRLVAPDFDYATGPGPVRTLRETLRQRLVLLVLYSLPASRPRLLELARAAGPLATLGLEVLAVPAGAAPGPISRLGASPPAPLPIVTDGAAEIVAAYGLLAPAPHAEILIDRQGYLRAIWAAAGTPGRDTNDLLADARTLNAELPAAPPPGAHVH